MGDDRSQLTLLGWPWLFSPHKAMHLHNLFFAKIERTNDIALHISRQETFSEPKDSSHFSLRGIVVPRSTMHLLDLAQRCNFDPDIRRKWTGTMSQSGLSPDPTPCQYIVKCKVETPREGGSSTSIFQLLLVRPRSTRGERLASS